MTRTVANHDSDDQPPTHPVVSITDDDMVIVRCPDCGQFEIWSTSELNDHGACRSSNAPCPVCGESPTPRQ